MEKLSSTYVFAELQSCTYTYNLLQFLAEMNIQHTAKPQKLLFFFLLSYDLKTLSIAHNLTF